MVSADAAEASDSETELDDNESAQSEQSDAESERSVSPGRRNSLSRFRPAQGEQAFRCRRQCLHFSTQLLTSKVFCAALVSGRFAKPQEGSTCEVWAQRCMLYRAPYLPVLQARMLQTELLDAVLQHCETCRTTAGIAQGGDPEPGPRQSLDLRSASLRVNQGKGGALPVDINPEVWSAVAVRQHDCRQPHSCHSSASEHGPSV